MAQLIIADERIYVFVIKNKYTGYCINCGYVQKFTDGKNGIIEVETSLP